MNGTIYCEFSGAVREAFRTLGHDVWSCDLLPSDDNSPYHHQGDAISFALQRDDQFAGVHWPCTYFANSSVRWMYGGKGTVLDPARVHLMKQSAFGLSKLLRILISADTPFYFENPVMHGMAEVEITRLVPEFATLDWQSVQPWNFGTWETKRTCLWLHKLPPLVPLYRTQEECRIALGLPTGSKPRAACHLASPGPNRGHERSRTLPTLAKQMASQWGALQPLPLDE